MAGVFRGDPDGICHDPSFRFHLFHLRLGGGNYSMLCDLSSPRTSGIFAYMYLTQCLSLSLFGASAAAYLGDIIPVLNSHWARVIVGVTLLTFFYVVNLMGVDIMAKAQKMMTWLLIAASSSLRSSASSR